MKCSLQKLCPCQSHPHFPWWLWVWGGLILVLFELLATVLSSGSIVALVGLEGDWQVPALIAEAGTSSQYQFGHVLIALCRAVFAPSFNLLGDDMGPLVVMIVKWTGGTVVMLFLCGDVWNSANGYPTGGVPTKGISGKGGTGSGGVPGGWTGTAWGAWSQWALKLGCSTDVLILLCSSGHQSTYTAEGHCHGNAPRLRLDGISWTHLGKYLLKGGINLLGHLYQPTFHASWPLWSAYCHIFKPTPVSPGPTHIPAELWLDRHLVEAWGLGESPTLPPSGCSLLDVDEGLTKGSTAKLDQEAVFLLWTFPQNLTWEWGCTFNPTSPLH